jgi:hypothetical protein
MNVHYKTSLSPSHETSHEVVLSHEFGHLHLEFCSEQDARNAVRFLEKAKFVAVDENSKSDCVPVRWPAPSPFGNRSAYVNPENVWTLWTDKDTVETRFCCQCGGEHPVR